MTKQKSSESMRKRKKLIHPELYFAGKLYRKLYPCMGTEMFKIINRFLNTFAKGRAFTGKIQYKQKYIKRDDGSALRVCIYSPKIHNKKTPALLWIHGGGFAIGVPEQELNFIKRFVLECGCTVISPDYMRSLDAPYPAAVNDCYNTLLWIQRESEFLGINKEMICVGGDSAGGSLCVAVCLLARDRGEVPIKVQIPLYPMLDYRETPSSKNNDAPIWNSHSNKIAWEKYLKGTVNVPKYASPALETDYSGLPPAITYVGTIEPFYDETVSYVKNLKKAGVPAEFKVFRGCFHGFDIACPNTRIAKKARRFLITSFNNELNKKDVLGK